MKSEARKLMEEIYDRSCPDDGSYNLGVKDGFTAAHTLAEQEIADLKEFNEEIKSKLLDDIEFQKTQIADLTASLKSAVAELQFYNDHDVENDVLAEIKAKHSDMFKGEGNEKAAQDV